MHDGVGSQSLWVPLAERVRILTEYKRIAIVGLSANPFRPSHFVAIYLISQGYDVIPVNPREKEILGRKCYASLRDIPGPVDVVDVFRDPSAVPAIVDEAIEIGAKVLWLQLGVIHEEAAAHAREAGLTVVMDRCMKIEHARLFGGLNSIGLNTGTLSSRAKKP
jgi:predicted CoA-binding protein